jgi:transcription-repair coupling factor (superfamily II helicase)
MVAFAHDEIDVLVCTTIIESGLDIPNANTLIIDRADRFGLSQLYQLRGRVGRGSHRAYTYLLIPRRTRITEAAGKRLKAILEATELGTGFRIAMRDLEIRGAGNVLGAEQSGHIHSVGFELYTHLLNEAVTEARMEQNGNGPVEDQATTTPARVSLPVSAHIPEGYVSHLPTRLAIYQRLTRAQRRQEVDDIREELRDRFGPLHQVVENLLYLLDLKLLAGEAGVESITQSNSTVTLALQEAVGGARLALEKALGPLARVGNQQVHIRVRLEGDSWRGTLVEVLERFLAFRERLPALAEGP